MGIASDALKLSILKVITLVLSTVTVIVLSRYRTLAEYGTYSQLKLIVGIAVSIFSLGMPNSINYFIKRANNEDEIETFTKTYFTSITAGGLVLGLLLVAMTPLFVAYFGNDEILAYVFVLFLLPWINWVGSSIDYYMIAYQKTATLMKFKLGNSAAIVLAAIITVVFNLSFLTYLILLMVIDSVSTLAIYYLVRKISGVKLFGFSIRTLRNILEYSLPIGISGIVGTLSIELDKLVVGRFFNTETLAIYENASRELPLAIVSVSITAVLLPKLVTYLKERKSNEAIRLWGQAVTISYIIMCFMVTMCIVFAEPIMTFLYSEKYLPGISNFRVFSLIVLFRVTYFGIILNASGKTKFILYSSVLSLVMNLILNLILINTLGLMGPSIATLLSMAVIAVCQLIFTSRVVKVPFKEIFPWKNLIQISIVNIVIGIITYFTYQLILDTISFNAIIVAILLVFTISAIYFVIMKSMTTKLWRILNN